jgi:hypothetical protein
MLTRLGWLAMGVLSGFVENSVHRGLGREVLALVAQARHDLLHGEITIRLAVDDLENTATLGRREFVGRRRVRAATPIVSAFCALFAPSLDSSRWQLQDRTCG